VVAPASRYAVFNSLSVEASRRFSDPLWVIDGVPMLSFTSPITGTNALAEIDPNDIETISVLKDCSIGGNIWFPCSKWGDSCDHKTRTL